MKLKYVGKQSDQLTIVDNKTGISYSTDEDGIATVPDDLGARLKEQKIWKELTPVAKKEKKGS